MPRTISEEAVPVHPGELARYLDANWNGWRNGVPETDYILYTAPGSAYVSIVSRYAPDEWSEFRPGWLVIDGQPCYSAAWL